MARPPKKGLDYFPFDTNFFNDTKIMRLLNQHGPLGLTVYLEILCSVYRDGYYLAIPLDELALYIMRQIGNRWVKSKDLVLQVIHYCADIGLLHDGLLGQNVITSVGIQKRYAEVTVRNKVNKDKYWLLESDEALFSAPEIPVSVTETKVFDAETQVSDAEMRTKKSKENKTKPLSNESVARKRFRPPTVEEVAAYCKERGNNVDPAHFVDYYTARGWKIGKQPMKDWKAAVRTWERNDFDSPKPEDKSGAQNGSFDTDDFFEAALRRSYIEESEGEGK